MIVLDLLAFDGSIRRSSDTSAPTPELKVIPVNNRLRAVGGICEYHKTPALLRSACNRPEDKHLERRTGLCILYKKKGQHYCWPEEEAAAEISVASRAYFMLSFLPILTDTTLISFLA